MDEIEKKAAEISSAIKATNDTVLELKTKHDEEIERMKINQKSLEDKLAAMEIAKPKEEGNGLEKAIKSFQNLFQKDASNNKLIIRPIGEVNLGEVVKSYSTANFTGDVPTTLDRRIGRLFEDKLTFLNDVNQVPISTIEVTLTNESSKTGDAEFTAEGNPKPLSEMEFSQEKHYIKKLAIMSTTTKEFLEDPSVLSIRNEIVNNLYFKADKELNRQILLGNGIGLNLNGIDKYSIAYANADLNATIENGLSNKYDILDAAVYTINQNTNGVCNRIYLNPGDLFELLKEKDLDANYYFSPDMRNRAVDIYVSGAQIKTNKLVPKGTFYACDMSLFNFRTFETVNLSVGLNGEDFRNNRISMIVETRVMTYVRATDVNSFIKSTFAAVKALIEKPL